MTGSRERVIALSPRLLGLRPRLLGALVLTSAVTLAVAALALLSPLENRLRTDGETTVKTALGAFRPDFAELPVDPATGRLDAHDLKEAVSRLRRRSHASVVVLDNRLAPITPAPFSGPGTPDYRALAGRALQLRKPLHTLAGNELIVAEPVEISGLPFVVVVLRRLDYLSSAAAVVRSAFIKAAAAGLLVALLLGAWLATTLLRRLRRLRDAARELERRGLDAFDMPASRAPDEVGELTRAFASLQSRLRRQEAARRLFVSTASHELRTPLASLDGMLELLEDDLDPARLDLQDARLRAARAREQTLTLTRLASDLLDLSRLDAEVELRSEPLELGEICRAVAAELELDASRREVAVAVSQPASPCWAQGDPGAVAQIVRILLDNALRVAPPGSRVELSSSGDADGIGGGGGGGSTLLTVRDSGPGVAPAERTLIFERFQRGASTGGRGGFGLGLAIGRELAARMGGTLELLESAEGACFQLRLPSAPHDDDKERAA
jgi:signal transduction histidine kinase